MEGLEGAANAIPQVEERAKALVDKVRSVIVWKESRKRYVLEVE